VLEPAFLMARLQVFSGKRNQKGGLEFKCRGLLFYKPLSPKGGGGERKRELGIREKGLPFEPAVS